MDGNLIENEQKKSILDQFFGIFKRKPGAQQPQQPPQQQQPKRYSAAQMRELAQLSNQLKLRNAALLSINTKIRTVKFTKKGTKKTRDALLAKYMREKTTIETAIAQMNARRQEIWNNPLPAGNKEGANNPGGKPKVNPPEKGPDPKGPQPIVQPKKNIVVNQGPPEQPLHDVNGKPPIKPKDEDEIINEEIEMGNGIPPLHEEEDKKPPVVKKKKPKRKIFILDPENEHDDHDEHVNGEIPVKPKGIGDVNGNGHNDDDEVEHDEEEILHHDEEEDELNLEIPVPQNLQGNPPPNEQELQQMVLQDLHDENPDPGIETADYLKGLSKVLTGKGTKYSEYDIEDLEKHPEGREAISVLAKTVIESQTGKEKEDKKIDFRQASTMLELNKSAFTSTAWLDSFEKMTSVFSRWDDMYLVGEFEKLDEVIQYASFIEKEVLPTLLERNTLSAKKMGNLQAIIFAIDEYAKYLDARLTLLAHPMYVTGIDELKLFGNWTDPSVLQKRAADFEKQNPEMSAQQLSFLYRAISFKELAGTNNVRNKKFNPKGNFSFQKLMEHYGYEKEKVEEPEIDDDDEELQDLQNQANAEKVLEQVNAIKVIEGENAPMTPEAIKMHTDNIYKIVTGKQENIPDEMREVMKQGMEDRTQMVNAARENLKMFDSVDPDQASEVAATLLQQLTADGFKMDPEILEFAKSYIIRFDGQEQDEIPPEMMENLKEYEKGVFKGLSYKGEDWESYSVYIKAIKDFMEDSQFEKLDGLDDASIQMNFGAAINLQRSGEAAKKLLEFILANDKCYICEERVNNFYKMLTGVNDYMRYAKELLVFMTLPLYQYIDADMIKEGVDPQAMLERAIAEHPEQQDKAYEFVQYMAETDQWRMQLGEGGFFERIGKIGYVPGVKYIDDDKELQRTYALVKIEKKKQQEELAIMREIARNKEEAEALPEFVEFNEEDEERIQQMQADYDRKIERAQGFIRNQKFFNAVQVMSGSNKVYEGVIDDEAYKKGVEDRTAKSVRVITGLKQYVSTTELAGDENVNLQELLNKDISAINGIEDDDYLIEHFRTIYLLCDVGKSAKLKLDAYEESGMPLPPAQKLKLTALKNLFADVESYLYAKLVLIGNPMYGMVHVQGERFGDNLDTSRVSRVAAQFRSTDVHQMEYIGMLDVMMNNPFRAKYSGDINATLNTYIADAVVTEDEALAKKNKGDYDSMEHLMLAIEFMMGDDEGYAENNYRANAKKFQKGASERAGVTARADEMHELAVRVNDAKQNALSEAYTKIEEEFPMIKIVVPDGMLDLIFDQIDTGSNEDALKHNMGLLLNLASADKNVRGSMYKEQVDHFLKIDLSKFDRIDDEYLIENYAELGSIALSARRLNQKETYDVFEQNGYIITEQKKKNVMAMAKAISDYMDIADKRMDLIRHPLYEKFYRKGDENKDPNDPAILERYSQVSAFLEGDQAEYFKILKEAVTHTYKPEVREMHMTERLLTYYGFDPDVVGNYDEDQPDKQGYQPELSVIRETYDDRVQQKEALFVHYVLTGKVQSLQHYLADDHNVALRAELTQKMHALTLPAGIPALELSDEPPEGEEDLDNDNYNVLKSFLGLSTDKMTNIQDDQSLVNMYEEIVPMLKTTTQAKHALEAYKADQTKKPLPKGMPFDLFYEYVEARLQMFEDTLAYVTMKHDHISHPLYAKYHDPSAYVEKEENGDANMAERSEEVSKYPVMTEELKQFTELSMQLKSSTFYKGFSGNFKDLEAAYGDDKTNPRTDTDIPLDKKAKFKGKGEKIDYLDENGKPIKDNEEPEPVKQGEEREHPEPPHNSKSMDGPWAEFVQLMNWISVSNTEGYNYVVTRSRLQKLTTKESDEFGFPREKSKMATLVEAGVMLDKKGKIVKKKVGRARRSEMQPILTKMQEITRFMNGEKFEYKMDQLRFTKQLRAILSDIRMLGFLCDQYLYGRRFKGTEDSVEQEVRHKVRRIRNIADYTYTQTLTSAKMAKIYMNQIVDKKPPEQVPFKDIYYYAEQPVPWPSQGMLVVYQQPVDTGMMKTIKGEKKELKNFGPEANTSTKVAHWLEIFEDRKPELESAVKREDEIREMDKIIKLVSTTNRRGEQLLPSDADDFLHATDDMVHAYQVAILRSKKFIEKQKGNMENDKVQKVMLENIISCLDDDIMLYEKCKDVVPDSYQKLKEDPEVRVVSDVFKVWKRDMSDWLKKEKKARKKAAQKKIEQVDA